MRTAPGFAAPGHAVMRASANSARVCKVPCDDIGLHRVPDQALMDKSQYWVQNTHVMRNHAATGRSTPRSSTYHWRPQLARGLASDGGGHRTQGIASFVYAQ